MRAKKNKAIVFLYLNTFTFFLAKIYQKLGFQAFYYKAQGKWQTDENFQKLQNEKIIGFDFSNFMLSNEYEVTTKKRYFIDLIAA